MSFFFLWAALLTGGIANPGLRAAPAHFPAPAQRVAPTHHHHPVAAPARINATRALPPRQQVWPRYQTGGISRSYYETARRQQLRHHVAQRRWQAHPRTLYYGGYAPSPVYWTNTQPEVYYNPGVTVYRDPFDSWQSIESIPYAIPVHQPAPVAEPPPVGASQIIVAVQLALRQYGFYRGAVDGINGLQTRRAIRAFKRHLGLPVNSRIDPQLLVSLRLRR